MAKAKAKAKGKIITAVQVLLAVVVVGAVGFLGWHAYQYWQADMFFSAMEQEYTNNADDNMGFQVDFDAVQEKYPGVVAWLRVPDLGLSRPVMQGTDDSFYLSHNPSGDYSYDGSIFLSAGCESLSDAHLLIYGHNMRDGSMFGSMDKFQDSSFFKTAAQTVYLYTPTETRVYKMFSVQVVSPYSSVYTLGFQHDEEFGAFVKQLQADSMHKTKNTVTQDDQVLTLSTCSNHVNRLVVSCVLSKTVPVS